MAPRVKAAAREAFATPDAVITGIEATKPTDRAMAELKVLWEVEFREANGEEGAVWLDAQGNVVEVKLLAIRSRFIPDRIEVNEGDELVIHVTNVEQTTDMIHGLGIIEHDMNVVVDPGETKTVKFTAGKAGVYPYYCTNFCSALHQEMQGYLAVKP